MLIWQMTSSPLRRGMLGSAEGILIKLGGLEPAGTKSFLILAFAASKALVKHGLLVSKIKPVQSGEMLMVGSNF